MWQKHRQEVGTETAKARGNWEPEGPQTSYYRSREAQKNQALGEEVVVLREEIWEPALEREGTSAQV